MLRYCARYAFLPFCTYEDENPSADDDKKLITLNVVDFVREELSDSDMKFSIEVFGLLFELLTKLRDEYERYLQSRLSATETEIAKIKEEGYRRIAESGMSMAGIEKAERDLEQQAADLRQQAERDAAMEFPCRILTSHENSVIRTLMLDLVVERHHLSNIYLKDGNTELEPDKLNTLLLRAIDEWKNEILNIRIKDLIHDIQQIESVGTPEEVQKLQLKLASLMNIRSQMAKCIGDRIIGTSR